MAKKSESLETLLLSGHPTNVYLITRITSVKYLQGGQYMKE